MLHVSDCGIAVNFHTNDPHRTLVGVMFDNIALAAPDASLAPMLQEFCKLHGIERGEQRAALDEAWLMYNKMRDEEEARDGS